MTHGLWGRAWVLRYSFSTDGVLDIGSGLESMQTQDQWVPRTPSVVEFDFRKGTLKGSDGVLIADGRRAVDRDLGLFGRGGKSFLPVRLPVRFCCGRSHRSDAGS